ncbi:hypothetical protein [Hansschlegelia beijingensis]|uniref:Uncharacterized protein n=1 Tax=Hansschlegelia beijingensis TaxID=1133344 RepID=A0A7W6GGG8_9HYPH|nr:hypothetical protein [Hansschlegelia beijingensis]MBB3972739.1 hypothetical protein [Hansschlegelia beijingensis]
MTLLAVVLVAAAAGFALCALTRVSAILAATLLPLLAAGAAFLAIAIFPSGGSTEPIVVPMLFILTAIGAIAGSGLGAWRRRAVARASGSV